MQVDVYEIRSKPGGMVSNAIPAFRITDEAVDIDVNAILQLGVKIHFLGGNHDYWTGDFLERELGFVVHKGPLKK